MRYHFLFLFWFPELSVLSPPAKFTRGTTQDKVIVLLRNWSDGKTKHVFVVLKYVFMYMYVIVVTTVDIGRKISQKHIHTFKFFDQTQF